MKPFSKILQSVIGIIDGIAEWSMERLERSLYGNTVQVAGYIVGASGCGKDYAAGRVLKEHASVTVAVTGDYCRDKHAISAGAGKLVSNERIQRFIRRRFFRCRRKVYLVDCPRSVEQVIETNRFFRSMGVQRFIVLHLHSTWKVCEQRIKHRAETKGRADDAQPDVIKRRLNVYFDEVSGLRTTLIPYLLECEDTEVVTIDVTGDLEEVRRHVVANIVPLFHPDQNSDNRVKAIA